MPKSRNRRRRSPSQVAATDGQSTLQDNAVDLQAGKFVPPTRVIAADATSKKPLVEITAAPQTKEPIVRIARRAGPGPHANSASETPLSASDAGETPRATNRDVELTSGESEVAMTARAPEKTVPTEAAAADVPAETPASDSAVQQGKTGARQTLGGLAAKAQELVRPIARKVTARVADMRAKRLAANADKEAVQLEDDANAAKGDLNRIAATLGDKSGAGKGDGLPGAFTRAIGLVSAWTQLVIAKTGRFLARHGINSYRDVGDKISDAMSDLAAVALALRVGVGALFIIGGWNKLSKLLSPAHSDGLVASYTSTTGYINEFFMGFLFTPGSALTPWSFLTALSAFELIAGVMLIAGLLVRPVALIFAFMLWSFVIALPVVTTNGVDPGVNTYMAPALLVQIRDVALSGIMFALFGLGSGLRSLDTRVFGDEAAQPIMSWDVAGVLLRLSTAVVLIVGGAFAGMQNIKTFIEPGVILLVLGLMLLWGGRTARYAAAATCAVLLIYMLGKIGIEKGLVGSLNAIKRELALFAGAFVIASRGCGELWTASDVARRLSEGFAAAVANLGTRAPRAEKIG